MTGQARRPAFGARYELQQADEGGAEVREGALAAEGDAGAGEGHRGVRYRGFVRLPDADVPVEVRVSLIDGAAEATVVSASVPAGGPSPRELERTAASLARVSVRSASAAGRSPPRRIARWRG